MVNKWGVKNFLPGVPDGEDDRTQDMHRKRLLDQFSAHPFNRKLSIIKSGMDKTFSCRRADIVNLSKSVAEILDMYPILVDCHQVHFNNCRQT